MTIAKPIVPWSFLVDYSVPKKPSYASLVSQVENHNHPQISIADLPSPTIKGGLVSIQVSEESYQRGLESCKYNLVGRLFLLKGMKPLPNSLSCSEFQLMSSTCELIHFPTRGLPYTWVRRGIRRNVEMRLDRCLGNVVWMDAWPSMTCCTLPRLISDHCPLLLTFDRLQLVSHPPFRFQQIWLKAPGFLQMVE